MATKQDKIIKGLKEYSHKLKFQYDLLQIRAVCTQNKLSSIKEMLNCIDIDMDTSKFKPEDVFEEYCLLSAKVRDIKDELERM